MLSSWFGSKPVAAALVVPEVIEPAPEVKHHVKDELIVFDIIPPAEQIFVDLFDQMSSCFWSSNELKFTQDASDVAKLTPKGRRLFEYILSFFSTADGEVLDNVVVNFQATAKCLTVRMAYACQGHFEAIHVKTYAAAMTVYIPDAAKRRELTMAFKTDPLIRDRDLWMSAFLAPAPSGVNEEKHNARRLIGFACAEALYFMSAFMVIAWLRSCDMFPIFGAANQFISRDEWMHVKLSIAYFHFLYNRQKLDEIGLSEDEMVNIVKEAVDLECQFATATVPSQDDPERLDGLRVHELITHIQNLGNIIISMLKINQRPWIVDLTKLPPFLSWLGIQPKANFYETTVTAYTTPSAVSEDPKRDADF